MKRLLWLTTASVLLLSMFTFCGCSGKNTTNFSSSGTEENTSHTYSENEKTYSGMTIEELELTKPNEYMLEKIEAGFDLTVGFAAIGDNQFTNQVLGESVREVVESYGFTYTFLAADVDTSIQIQQIENFVTMGTSIVIALPLDADQIKDTVIKAQQAGTTVVLWGVTADYDTILVQTDQEDLGTQIGNMALAWLDQAYPNAETGSIPTAIMGQSSVVDVIKRTEAVTNTVAADSRINITIEFDNCQDDINDGFIRMEEAMTVSPDLILVTNNCVANAVGNNNYVMAQQPDKAQNIGIFCADYDSTLDEIFPLVESGGACLRGTIQCGETPQASLVDCIDGIINGEIVSPYVVVNQLFSYVCPTFNYSYDARTI